MKSSLSTRCGNGISRGRRFCFSCFAPRHGSCASGVTARLRGLAERCHDHTRCRDRLVSTLGKTRRRRQRSIPGRLLAGVARMAPFMRCTAKVVIVSPARLQPARSRGMSGRRDCSGVCGTGVAGELHRRPVLFRLFHARSACPKSMAIGLILGNRQLRPDDMTMSPETHPVQHRCGVTRSEPGSASMAHAQPGRLIGGAHRDGVVV